MPRRHSYAMILLLVALAIAAAVMGGGFFDGHLLEV
jgi:hypothetical protein